MQRDNECGPVAVEPDALYVRVTHLLAADDALDEQFQCGVYAGGLLVRAGPCQECDEKPPVDDPHPHGSPNHA
jgi:hypothetical protein